MLPEFTRRARARLFLGTALVALAAGSARSQSATDYYYDSLGRLVAAVNSDGKAVGYAYDLAGNRISLSNRVPVDEIRPAQFLSSGQSGTTGLTAANGMRDGNFSANNSIAVLGLAANTYVTADFGSLQHLDHVDLATAHFSSYGAANVNGTNLQWSTDNITWSSPAIVVSGVTTSGYASIPMGGVNARYVRIQQPSATVRMVLGDFRFYSTSTTGNQPPIADSFAVNAQSNVTTTIDLTNHIRDPNNDPVRVTTLNQPTAPQIGATAIVDGHTLTYTPNTNASGPDTFSYTITDDRNGFATGLITMSVAQPNRPPVANPEAIGTDPGVPITLNVLDNDTDPDGDGLTLIDAQPAAGSGGVTFQSNGSLTFTPGTSFSGQTTLSYTISDGHAHTASTTDTVTVQYGAGPNHPPSVTRDVKSMSLGAPFSFDPTQNDSDIDHDPLTLTAVTQGTTGGTVTRNGNIVTYTAPAGAQPNGFDTFTYSVTDGRSSPITGDVTMTFLAAPNHPPTAVNDFVTANGSNSLDISPLSNDYDQDAGDAIILQSIQVPPSHGTAQIMPDHTTIRYQALNGNTGTDDTFVYVVQDRNLATAQATVTVHINNQPPFAFPVNRSVANGGQVTITIPVTGENGDPDQQPITFLSFGAPSLGSIIPNGSSATYTSTAGTAGGNDTFNYTITDGALTATSTITISVSPASQLSVTPSVNIWSGLKNVDNNVVSNDAPITLSINGSGDYSYSWQYVSGSTAISATNASGASTSFTATPVRNQQYQATWKCVVTDNVSHLSGETGPITVKYEIATND